MATPQNSGSTPSRPNEFLPLADPALSAAVQQAGLHPERAAVLAAQLGIGLAKQGGAR